MPYQNVIVCTALSVDVLNPAYYFNSSPPGTIAPLHFSCSISCLTRKGQIMKVKSFFDLKYLQTKGIQSFFSRPINKLKEDVSVCDFIGQ